MYAVSYSSLLKRLTAGSEEFAMSKGICDEHCSSIDIPYPLEGETELSEDFAAPR